VTSLAVKIGAMHLRQLKSQGAWLAEHRSKLEMLVLARSDYASEV